MTAADGTALKTPPVRLWMHLLCWRPQHFVTVCF